MYEEDNESRYLREIYDTILLTQEGFVQSLSPDRIRSLRYYTGGDLNTGLRKGISKYMGQNHIDNIDSVFNDIPPIDNALTVFRGLQATEADLRKTDKGYVSASLLKSVAMKFTGKTCCVLQITLSPNTKIIPLHTISDISEEQEILLERNGTFIVTGSAFGSITENNIKTMFVTYIPERSVELRELLQTSEEEKILKIQR